MAPSASMLLQSLLCLLGLLTSKAPSAAAESSALTCTATRLPDGSVQYRLSQPPALAQCDTCWEDENKTVIARDSKFNSDLIENLTNRSVSLKTCRDFLLYTRDCSGVAEEAQCRVNCSDLRGQELLHVNTVNVTRTCITERWCPDQKTVILLIIFIVGVVFSAAIVFWVLFHFGFICKRRCNCETVSYSPGTLKAKTEPHMDVGQTLV